MKIDYSIIVPIIRNGHLRGCFHIGVIRINRINIILNSLSYRYSFCYTMSPAGTINRSLLRSSIPYHYPRFSYKQVAPTGLLCAPSPGVTTQEVQEKVPYILMTGSHISARACGYCSYFQKVCTCSGGWAHCIIKICLPPFCYLEFILN